jgi:autotransporter-associated beta strand protein
MKPSRRNLVLTATLCFTLGQASHAAGLHWDADGDASAATGGAGTWTTANTWRDGSATGTLGNWADGNDAVFAGTAGTVTLGSNISALSASFSTTAYILTGGGSTLTLTGTGTGTSSAVNATVAAATINAVVNFGAAANSTQGVNITTGTTVFGFGVASTNSISMAKTGAGILRISGTNGPSSLTGSIDVLAGTVELSGPGSATPVTIFSGSTPTLNLGDTTGTSAATFSVVNNAITANNNILVRAGSTGAKTIGVALPSGSSVTFTTTGTITLDDNVTLNPNTNCVLNPNGLISDGANGAKGITKAGPGTVNLSHAHDYSGRTSVTAGTLALTGANGSLPDTSGISVSAGTLQLNNTAAANNANRIPDATVITMTGGTLDFKNNAGAADYAETVAITAAGGGTVNNSQAAVGQTSTLTIGTFARNPGGTLSFTGTGLGQNAQNRILFTTPPTLTNGVIPWATAGTTTFAAYDNTNGVTPATTSDLTAQGSTIADGPTSNLRITSDGTGAAIALGATTTSINTLVQANTTLATTPTIDTAGKILQLNGVLVASPTNTRGLTIGTAANDGTLMAGTPGGDLFLNNSSANTLTVNALIADNTSASSLNKSGTGNATFTGTNTYTGATSLNGGIVTAANNRAFGTGVVTTSAGATRLVVTNGIDLANDITFNGGGASLRGFFENSGAGGNATLSGAITISGNLVGGGHFGSSGTGGSLTVTGPITSTGPNVVSRLGTVIFSGGGSYTNFTLSEGTVRLGADNGLSTTSVLEVANSGTGIFDLAGYNQSLTGITRTSSNGATIGNSSTASNSILTITGTSTYGGGITNVVSPGDKLTTLRIANGANLTLTGSFTATTPDIQSGGTLTIGAGGGDGINPSTKSLLVPSGATLRFTSTNRVQNDTVITVNPGGTFDQNGQADTIGYLNGAGSVTNLNAGLTLSMPLVGSGSDFNGSISGTGGITVSGNGTGGSDINVQILSGVNSFTGNVTVQRGLLRITNSSALGEAPVEGTKTISIFAGSNKFLELDGTSGAITLPSTFLFSTSGVNGAIRNLAGNNTIDGAFSLTSGNGNTKIVSNGGSLTLNGNVTTVASAGANRVFDLDGTSAANNAVNGVISNGGGFLTGVTKNGTGKWTLAGPNTYTSPTIVNGGTLHLTGSIAAGSAVTVGGNTATGSPTLTGAGGTVNGTLTIAAAGTGVAGTVSPGTVGTTGTLNAGPTTIAGTYTCDVSGTSTDLLAVTGDLDLTGSTLAISGTATSGTYVIASYTGTRTAILGGTLPAGYSVNYDDTSKKVELVVSTSASPYETWGAPYGLTAGSEGGDLDNDGLTNQQEFAFGLIPNNGSSVNPIVVQLDKTTGRFTYQRLTASGLNYTIWTSPDLSTWTKDDTAGQAPSTVGANQNVVVTLSASPKPLTATKLFVRVQAN